MTRLHMRNGNVIAIEGTAAEFWAKAKMLRGDFTPIVFIDAISPSYRGKYSHTTRSDKIWVNVQSIDFVSEDYHEG